MAAPRKDFLDNDDFKVIWHGFDGSVIFNKATQQQEWVRNSEYRIPVRPRYDPEKGWRKRWNKR